MATTTQDLQKELKKTTTDAVGLAKSTVDKVQRDINETVGEARDTVQNVFLAGLGALSLAEEEGSKLFKTLVQKGETVELPGASRLKAVRDDLGTRADQATNLVKGRVGSARTTAEDTADKAEDRLQDSVAAVMKRLGVPTRDEVAELSASVERLTTRIERLKTDRDASTELSMQAVGGGWYEIRIGDVVIEKVQGKEDAEAALIRVQEQRA